MLKERAPVGQRVAIIGAGGIGFDTAEYLTHEGESGSLNQKNFMKSGVLILTMNMSEV